MAGNPLASLPGLPQRPSLARSSASETRLTQPGIEAARSRKLNSAPTAAFRFNPAGTTKFISPCDIAKSALARAAVAYRNEAVAADTPTSVVVGDRAILAGSGLTEELTQAIVAAGYPTAVN